MPDRPSENLDKRLSEHVLAFHMGQQIKRDNFNATNSSLSLGESGESVIGETLSLEDRLRIGISNREIIPSRLLRKYIAYARAYVNPK